MPPILELPAPQDDIWLRNIISGQITFSETDYNTLESIAAMCPLFDGEAVLPARVMLAPVREEPFVYDDKSVCHIQRGQAGTTTPDGFLRVYPNPTAARLTIEYGFATSSGSLFQVFNGQGQVVKSLVLPDGQGKIEISLDNLPAGTYWYALLGAPLRSGKILVVR